MGDLLLKLFVMSSAGSAVVLLTLMLGPVTERIFPANRQYLIWKAALFFFVVPVSFIISRLSLPLPFLPIHSPGIYGSLNDLNHSLWSTHVSNQFTNAVFFLWLAGAVTFAAWQLSCRRRFWNRIRSGSTPLRRNGTATAALASCKAELGIGGKVALMQCNRIKSPMIVGILRPTVLLPSADMEETDLELILTHELIHLKHRDLWLKSLALCAGALHWYNPLVHVMRKKIALWSEFACDEAVISEMSRAERKRYGEAILNGLSPHRKQETIFCSALSGGGEHLKKRLIRILQFGKKGKPITVLSIAAAFVICSAGAAVAFAASEWKDMDAEAVSAPAPALTQGEQTIGTSEESSTLSEQGQQERLEEEIYRKTGMRIEVKIGTLSFKSSEQSAADQAGKTGNEE